MGDFMGRMLATMVTMTTYGTWLRGDRRGWVDDGVIYPPDVELEARDRASMKHPPFRFAVDDLLKIGQFIGEELAVRRRFELLALTVQTWHVHFVLGATQFAIGEVVKWAKEAVRYGLKPNRPIWTDGFDKRFCFDVAAANGRISYVERHNLAKGWPARPWTFITPFSP